MKSIRSIALSVALLATSASVMAQSRTVLFPGESSPDGEYVCVSRKQEPKHKCEIRRSTSNFGLTEDGGKETFVYIDGQLYASFTTYHATNNCMNAQKIVKDLEMSNKCKVIKNACL